jgi:hypothetical protein
LEGFQVARSARFACFARLGSVQRTARTHPNQSTAKKSDSETGKLATGRIRSKTKPIATTTNSLIATIKTYTPMIHIGFALLLVVAPKKLVRLVALHET